MPLEYGYLKAVIAGAARIVGPDRRGEYHLHANLRASPDTGAPLWDMAINVGSSDASDRLKYRITFSFSHPIQATLRAAVAGWHDLTGVRSLPAVDFLRSTVLRGTGSWTDSDVQDGTANKEPYASLSRLIQGTMGRPHFAYVFGRPYPGGPPFGVHDVHMNQGSTGNQRSNNALWQDGGLLLDLQSECVACFSAFTKQFVPTDAEGSPTVSAEPIADPNVGSLVPGS